jgi:hypothetical protein
MRSDSETRKGGTRSPRIDDRLQKGIENEDHDRCQVSFDEELIQQKLQRVQHGREKVFPSKLLPKERGYAPISASPYGTILTTSSSGRNSTIRDGIHHQQHQEPIFSSDTSYMHLPGFNNFATVTTNSLCNRNAMNQEERAYGRDGVLPSDLLFQQNTLPMNRLESDHERKISKLRLNQDPRHHDDAGMAIWPPPVQQDLHYIRGIDAEEHSEPKASKQARPPLDKARLLLRGRGGHPSEYSNSLSDQDFAHPPASLQHDDPLLYINQEFSTVASYQEAAARGASFAGGHNQYHQSPHSPLTHSFRLGPSQAFHQCPPPPRVTSCDEVFQRMRQMRSGRTSTCC